MNLRRFTARTTRDSAPFTNHLASTSRIVPAPPPRLLFLFEFLRRRARQQLLCVRPYFRWVVQKAIFQDPFPFAPHAHLQVPTVPNCSLGREDKEALTCGAPELPSLPAQTEEAGRTQLDGRTI